MCAMWYFIGFLNLVGFFMVLFFILLQRIIYSKFELYDRKRRKLMDTRAGMSAEIINGVKNIKFNALEKVYKEKIDTIRKGEKSLLGKMFRIYTLTASYLLVMCSVIGLIVFSILKTVTKKEISVGAMFAILMLLTRLAMIVDFFITEISEIYSSFPSFSRLNIFMKLKERVGMDQDQKGVLPGSVSFSEYSATWNDFETQNQIKRLNVSLGGENVEEEGEKVEDLVGVESNVLLNFDFEVRPHEFIGVIGKVGSGKTSLIRAICGDLKVSGGSVRSKGKIALVAQQAFLVNDTLKNNILFGMDYDKKKYDEIIRICQLESDLKILTYGDQTEIGERGINLSGGQKQRVSLARAVYSDSDIYLIDDCLSALDAHVGKKILKEVLLGYLKRKKKTVIMTTHHTHFLSAFDKVLLLDSGRIALMGSHSELKQTKEFQSFVISLEEENKHNSEDEDWADPEIQGPEQNDALLEDSDIEEKSILEDSNNQSENQGRLTVEETRFTGIVGNKVMAFYIKKGNLLQFILTIIAFTSVTWAAISTEWWAGKWFNHDYSLTDAQFIGIYFVLTVILVLLVLVRSFLFSKFSPSASYNIYKKLLWNLLRKPMSFFDTNPSGVIMNRAIDDMETVEQEFPKRIFMFLDLFLVVLASFTLMVVSSIYLSLILVLMVVVYCVVFFKYLRSSIELKRIFRIARSPVLTTLSEMVNGATQIRLYGYKENLKSKWASNQEISVSAELHERYCFAWVSIWINLSFGLVALALGISIAFKKNSG